MLLIQRRLTTEISIDIFGLVSWIIVARTFESLPGLRTEQTRENNKALPVNSKASIGINAPTNGGPQSNMAAAANTWGSFRMNTQQHWPTTPHTLASSPESLKD